MIKEFIFHACKSRNHLYLSAQMHKKSMTNNNKEKQQHSHA